MTLRAMAHGALARLADWLDGLAVVLAPREIVHDACTGIAAVWCPVHGDCTCEEPCPSCFVRERGSTYLVDGGAFYTWACRRCGLRFEADSPPRESAWCALHGPHSAHAIEKGHAA